MNGKDDAGLEQSEARLQGKCCSWAKVHFCSIQVESGIHKVKQNVVLQKDHRSLRFWNKKEIKLESVENAG